MAIRSFLYGVALVGFALPAIAQQGVAGKWNASIDTPNGPFALVFEFLVDAAGKLTGSMRNDFTGSLPIEDAVLSGNNVKFKLTFNGPDGALKVIYDGTVKGDELALKSKLEGTPPQGAGPAERTFAAQRAK